MRFAILTLIVLALAAPAKADEKAVSFEKDVMPIFKASCISCHKADKKKGKLDMSTYADLMKGGKQGNPVKPGDPYQLWGMSLGCKTVLIYSPEDLSCQWESNNFKDGKGLKAFQLGANIVAYATGREPPKPRLTQVDVSRDIDPRIPPPPGGDRDAPRLPSWDTDGERQRAGCLVQARRRELVEPVRDERPPQVDGLAARSAQAQLEPVGAHALARSRSR